MNLHELLKKTGHKRAQIQKHLTTKDLTKNLHHECVGTSACCKAEVEYFPNGLFGSLFHHPVTFLQDVATSTLTEQIYIYRIFKGIWISMGNETKKEGMMKLRKEYEHRMNQLKQHLDLLPDRQLNILPEGVTAETFDKSLMNIQNTIKGELLTQYNIRTTTAILCSRKPVFKFTDHFFIKLPDIVTLEVTSFGDERTALAKVALQSIN